MNGIRFTLAAGAAAAIALASFSAHANEERGLSVGVSAGYGAPLGKAYGGNPIYAGSPLASDTTLASFQGGMLPFRFAAGYRFNRKWYLGAWYQFGITRPPQAMCTVGASCDGSDQRFGLEVNYHIRPTELVDPWVGLGLGYEVARVNTELPSGTETSLLAKGFQYFDLQAGLDLRFSEKVPFGPFIDFSLGKFTGYSSRDQNSVSTSLDLPDGTHEWLTLGLRAQFNL